MKTKLIKKSIIYTLIGSICFGGVTPAFAGRNSIGEVTKTQETDKSESLNTTVYAELGSFFKVSIPKHIILDGTTKSGAYTVSAIGDIAGYETLKVTPDKSFALKSNNLADVTASISQDKTEWSYNEMLEDSNVLGNGAIDAKDISAGSWNGNFNFNIFLDGSTTSIKVEAKDENGVDLEASAFDINGSEKEALLNGLVESGLIESTNEVDALIEVNSNEFDGIANTTFDVSSIAKEGEKIAILHFNEETSEWEYISTETVNSNGKITVDFTSYSPVAFVKVNSDGTYDKVGLAPGLYDANDNLVCTWKNSGINIEADYTYNTYNTNTSSPYYVLTNNYPTTTKVVLPDGITKIGDYTFNDCKKLTNINISKNVTSIGSCAFQDCDNLTSIEIPESVTYISNGAFRNSKNITSLKIFGDSIYIGGQAFYGCRQLNYVMVPASATYGENVFSASYPAEVHITKGTGIMTNFTTHDYINSPFRNNDELVKLTIEDGVTNIGSYAFYSCNNLTNIEIPESVTSIGQNAFEQCEKLTSIYIPSSVTTISANEYLYSPFYKCNSTLKIYCGAKHTQSGWKPYWNYYKSEQTLSVTYGIARTDYEINYK